MKNIRKLFSKKKVFGNQSGFTLLEVLIAISILTVGLLGVAQMQIMGIRGNYFSGNTTTALTLAEEKMEDLLGKSYSDTDLDDTETGNNANLTSITTIEHEELNIDETGQVGGGIYHRIWNVADNTPILGTKTVAVIATWDNDSHRVTLSCIKPQ
jgi:type IV pilus assembly protein PilV